MKIAHKGLILITVPLLVELAFLGVLAHLVNRADAAVKREALSKRIVHSAGNVQRYLVECGTSVAIYKFSSVESYREKALSSVQLAKQELNGLGDLVKNEPEQMARLGKAKKAVAEGTDVAKKLIEKLHRKEDIERVFIDYNLGPLRKLMDQIMSRLTTVVNTETAAAKEFAAQEARAREAVLITLWTGVAVNILIALGVALLFFRGVASRIDLVIDNARRVPKKLPLNERIRGNDEISELDAVLHATVAELEESESMRQMLISMVSHDLRSPLTSVSTALELLTSGIVGELPATAMPTAEQAVSDVSKLLTLTNDLLDADRLASGSIDLHCHEIAVLDLLTDSVETVRIMARQYEVELHVDLENDFDIYADPERLKQVLVNLTSNAIKYSPPGGAVTLKCIQSASNTVEFQVIDEGAGIAPEHHELIFEKFVQVNTEALDNAGKGLGLAICKSLVDLHHGAIGVTSDGAHGSTFWFSIPLQDLPSTKLNR